MNLRIKATKYNIINITAIIIFPLLFVLQFFIWDWWIILLDDDTLAILIGWPIYLMIGTIILNKISIKKYIHKENEHHYDAHNVKIDTVKDNGSLPKEFKDLLPDFLHEKRRKTKIDFDLFASGEIADLQMKYKVDKFNFLVKERLPLSDDYNTIFSFKGDALIVEYKNISFGSSPIIFLNNSMIHATKKAVFSVSDTMEIPGNGFLLYDKRRTDENLIEQLKLIISGEVKPNNGNRIYIIFKNNTLVFLTNAKHKFKIKVPFLIHKNKIEDLVDNQKAQIYRFNMFLNKISTLFN